MPSPKEKLEDCDKVILANEKNVKLMEEILNTL